MEIAVISDIHANPLALEAVLEMVQEVDRIYCLGDLVGIGPLPAETLDIMRREDRIFNVIGNHDHNTLHGTELGPIEEIPRKPHHEWVRSKLSKMHMEYLDSPRVEFFDNGPSIVFMHRHIDDWWSKVPYFYDSSPAVLDEFYRDVGGDILFFGHTHIPLDVTGNGGRRYINPGAVGAENAGLARFVKVRIGRGDEIDIEHHAVPYDRDAVREDLRDQGAPYWEFIFDRFYGTHPAGFDR